MCVGGQVCLSSLVILRPALTMATVLTVNYRHIMAASSALDLLWALTHLNGGVFFL